MKFDLEETITLLSRTPSALDAFLRDLPQAWTIRNEGDKTWSPFEIVGHLIHGELTDWIPRVSVILEHAMNLRPADFDRRGRHPALGAVTLSQLLATWAVHDLTHLHQLSRVMAYQYREVVGPWSAYLGVLHCQGHGA